jgi:hypothetical protein
MRFRIIRQQYAFYSAKGKDSTGWYDMRKLRIGYIKGMRSLESHQNFSEFE